MERVDIFELTVVKTAVDAVADKTGLQLRFEVPAANNRPTFDAMVRIEKGPPLAALVKRWVPLTNLGAIIHQIHALPQPALLVADYVNPNAAQKLRQEGVQFIDMMGNAFINQLPLFIFITGGRAKATPTALTDEGHDIKRAFDPKGLLLIYALLCDPLLINKPYRDIADTAGIALGGVGTILKGLKAAGYIREGNKHPKRKLVNYRKLLDRWVELWPETLRPKYLLGKFVTDKPDFKQTPIFKHNGLWGAETAAALIETGLQPQINTIYVPGAQLNDLLHQVRLRKATLQPGEPVPNVVIYQTFWPLKQMVGEHHFVVNPVLTYADLIATGDPRNREVADMIFEKNLAKYCQ